MVKGWRRVTERERGTILAEGEGDVQSDGVEKGGEDEKERKKEKKRRKGKGKGRRRGLSENFAKRRRQRIIGSGRRKKRV